MVECFDLGNKFTVAILSVFCRLKNFNNRMVKKKKKVKENLTRFATHVLFYLCFPRHGPGFPAPSASSQPLPSPG